MVPGGKAVQAVKARYLQGALCRGPDRHKQVGRVIYPERSARLPVLSSIDHRVEVS